MLGEKEDDLVDALNHCKMPSAGKNPIPMEIVHDYIEHI